MANLSDQMLEITSHWGDRNSKQMRFALAVAAVIALLLWQTVWLRLRPPLGILLLGQFGVAVALFMRSKSLAASAKTALPATEPQVHKTFSEEQSFSFRLATFEYTCQFVGFVWLGYEFWLATRSLPVAILICVVYPLSAYWGLARPRMAKRKRLLKSEEEKILRG